MDRGIDAATAGTPALDMDMVRRWSTGSREVESRTTGSTQPDGWQSYLGGVTMDMDGGRSWSRLFSTEQASCVIKPTVIFVRSEIGKQSVVVESG